MSTLGINFNTNVKTMDEVRQSLQQIRFQMNETMFPIPDTVELIEDQSTGFSMRFELAALSADRVVTVPDAAFTIAGLQIANVFTANQEIAKANPTLTLDDSTGAGTASLLFQTSNATKFSLNLSSTGPSPYAKFHAASLSFLILDSADATRFAFEDAGKLDITPSGTVQDALSINHSNGQFRIQGGTYGGSTGYGAFWGGNITPDDTNHMLRGDGATKTELNADTGDYLAFSIGGAEMFTATNAAFLPAVDITDQSLGSTAKRFRTANAMELIAHGGTVLATGDIPSGVEGVVISHDSANNFGQLACGHNAVAWHAMRYHAAQHEFFCSGTQEILLNGTSFEPVTDATGLTLGGASNRWGLFSGTTAILKPAANSGAILSLKDTSGNPSVQAGNYPGAESYGTIYLGNVTASGANYNIAGNGTDLLLNAVGAAGIVGCLIQGGLVWSTGNSEYSWKPGTDASYDIGTTSLRPRDGYFSRNLFLGATSVGTNGTQTQVFLNGTPPAGNVTDASQQYTADIAAGNSAPHFRTENGSIIKLFTSSAYTPSNVTTDRTFDANSTSLDEIADVLGSLIADLQATGLIG